MDIRFVCEFELEESMKRQIAELLAACFPEIDYDGRPRHYFKQLPHYRLLLINDSKLIGQMGIDYRVMSLNKKPVTVLGVADLTIHPDYQGKGYGTQLMQKFIGLATSHPHNIDFLFLVTDKPGFYERLGFVKTNPKVTWMKIHKGETHSIGNERINDSYLMYKSISGKPWEDGSLDMMGYWY
ncbi:MAG TPA: GNAT family N-acetyltransferase [Chitinophagales bacterium]|nr:GNAT family N-acetyltransferase [Chitinophagales bacterium]